MKKPDARLLNPTTQNYLRQQAIRLRQQGKQIVELLPIWVCIAIPLPIGERTIKSEAKLG